jgi:hypothetical protein
MCSGRGNRLMARVFTRLIAAHATATESLLLLLSIIHLRLSALEMLLEDGELINESGPWEAPLINSFRLTFAQVAAVLASLSAAVAPADGLVRGGNGKRPAGRGGPAAAGPARDEESGFCGCEKMFGVTWGDVRVQLRSEMVNAVEGYWGGVMKKDHLELPDSMEVRRVGKGGRGGKRRGRGGARGEGDGKQMLEVKFGGKGTYHSGQGVSNRLFLWQGTNWS